MPAGPVGSGPVGRDEFLDLAWRRLAAGHSLLVSGPAGIGRSTVVRALAETAARAGHRVLRCASAEDEASLPYLTLIDLLDAVGDDPVWDELPRRWQAALAAVREGSPAGADRAGQLALRLAALRLCRGLGRRQPLLLVVDDLQWVDPASAQVLRFVASRLGDLPVRMLAAERSPPGAPVVGRGRRLCPAPMVELALPPLSSSAMGELLRRHSGVDHPPSLVVRVHRVSGGNPWYGLEITRALRGLSRPPGPSEPLPIPDRLRALTAPRLGTLPTTTRRALLLASAAERPTTGLLHRAGRRQARAELVPAVEAGIVRVEPGGAVRFPDPLLAAAVYADSAPGQRRRAHARLAAAVSDPVARARHRALATTGPDEPLAASLIRAAGLARRRGAPDLAAELAMAAADRTPAPTRAVGRLLRAAADALAAGHCDLARQAALAALAAAGSRQQRVRAWLVILDATSQALARADPVITQALAAAGQSPGLQAQIRIRVVGKALVEGQLSRALTEAGRCCALAEQAGDRPTLARALCLRATAELVMGRPELPGTLRRARAAAQGDHDAPLYQGPRHLQARDYLHQDRFDAARAELAPLLAIAEQRGRREELVGLLLNLAELELRSGRCQPALRAARRCLALVAEADLSAGPCLSVAALAEAVGGDPAHARVLADRGVRRSEADGDRFFLPRSLHALGYAALLAGDPPAAVAALRRVAAIDAEMGQPDPALLRWHADLAEALVANQELAGAAELIGQAGGVARRHRRESVLAALARAEGLLLLARREPSAAAARLRVAADQLAGLPVEHGRALFALGVAERRRRRRGAARAGFEQALAVFERAGALPWARRTRAELTSTEPAPGGGLTSIEHRIAQLVRTGATNRQVATALSVSVKTVEAYLTRIYRKLGVRSRAELAGAAAGRDV